MAQKSTEDRETFEEKLDRALDEAWSKVTKALDQTRDTPSDFEASVRFAAEAVEYSSALFSLTYGLEDFDPEVKIKKGIDPQILVKDSADALRKARELRRKSPRDAYSSLRTAADYLKRAYLDQVKETSKRRS